MRALMLALLLAFGVALFGTTSSVSAAPANGTAISDQAAKTNSVVHVQHWRWRSRRAYVGCHTRPWSRWRARCWM